MPKDVMQHDYARLIFFAAFELITEKYRPDAFTPCSVTTRTWCSFQASLKFRSKLLSSTRSDLFEEFLNFTNNKEQDLFDSQSNLYLKYDFEF